MEENGDLLPVIQSALENDSWNESMDELLTDDQVKACGRLGFTALHIAAMKGNVRVVQLLLEKKADINAMNTMNETPLMMACMYLAKDVVKVLLEHGADKKKRCWRGKSAEFFARESFMVAIGQTEVQEQEEVIDLVREEPLEHNANKAESLKQQGNGFFKKEKWEDAIAHYTVSLEYNPNNAIVLSNRSAAFLKMKRMLCAKKDALKAISCDPHYIKGHYRLAAVLLQMGDFRGAEEAVKRSIAIQNTEEATAMQNTIDATRKKEDDELVSGLTEFPHYVGSFDRDAYPILGSGEGEGVRCWTCVAAGMKENGKLKKTGDPVVFSIEFFTLIRLGRGCDGAEMVVHKNDIGEMVMNNGRVVKPMDCGMWWRSEREPVVMKKKKDEEAGFEFDDDLEDEKEILKRDRSIIVEICGDMVAGKRLKRVNLQPGEFTVVSQCFPVIATNEKEALSRIKGFCFHPTLNGQVVQVEVNLKRDLVRKAYAHFGTAVVGTAPTANAVLPDRKAMRKSWIGEDGGDGVEDDSILVRTVKTRENVFKEDVRVVAMKMGEKIKDVLARLEGGPQQMVRIEDDRVLEPEDEISTALIKEMDMVVLQ